MARTVLHADESFVNPTSRKYQLVAITENEAGYTPLGSDWTSLEAAQEYAARRNTNAGYTEKDVLDIRASSMAAGRVRS